VGSCGGPSYPVQNRTVVLDGPGPRLGAVRVVRGIAVRRAPRHRGQRPAASVGHRPCLDRPATNANSGLDTAAPPSRFLRLSAVIVTSLMLECGGHGGRPRGSPYGRPAAVLPNWAWSARPVASERNSGR
jgi:hypothetical protein